MPVNKNALIRYRVLDACLSNRRRTFTKDQLLDAVNDSLRDLYGESKTIKLRQLDADLAFLKDSQGYNAEIELIPAGDGRKMNYRYADPDFSIFTTNLSEKELAKLQSAFDVLSQFRSNPAYARVATALSEIEYTFGLTPNRENLISFGTNEQFVGLEHLSTLIDYTVNHQPLEIQYEPYGQTVFTAEVHPYYLKQYNNRWFLFGFNVEKQNVSTFALDRIKHIKPSEAKFIPNKDRDYSTWFDDVIGVSVDDRIPVEEVVLKFHPDRFKYVVTKPLHRTQKTIDEVNCVIEIRVRPNRELNQQIFSFGPDVEVLAPESLRKSIAEKIAVNYKKYFAMQNDCIDDTELCTQKLQID